jgi:hypothetical protein
MNTPDCTTDYAHGGTETEYRHIAKAHALAPLIDHCVTMPNLEVGVKVLNHMNLFHRARVALIAESYFVRVFCKQKDLLRVRQALEQFSQAS